LVTFDGSDHYKLSEEEYETVCKITKIIPQRALMGANLINFRAHEIIYNLMAIKLMKHLLNGIKKKINVLLVLLLSGIMLD
jgi:hypothetical protein